MLLGERLRQASECETVQRILTKLMPHANLNRATMYGKVHAETQGPAASAKRSTHSASDVPAAVWIGSTVRLYALVARCMEHDEPVLLVGETGTGKTTVCQLYAQAIGQTLHMINCHQNTETSDFIGGLRPARGRTFQLQTLTHGVCAFEAAVRRALEGSAANGDGSTHAGAAGAVGDASGGVGDGVGGEEPSVAELLARVATARAQLAKGQLAAESLATLEGQAAELKALGERCNALFVWQDGPLLTAMRRGELLLIDEISLAEDAVRKEARRPPTNSFLSVGD